MANVNAPSPEGPTVTIHKGWLQNINSSRKTPASNIDQSTTDTSSPEDGSSMDDNAKPSQFEFINATGPNSNRDVEVQRRVRRHVRYKHFRDQKNAQVRRLSLSRRLSNTELLRITSEKSAAAQPKYCIPELMGYPTAALNSSYPISMDTDTHRLLSGYLESRGRRMCALESCLTSNPLQSPTWFHFAVTDATMFHAMLYAGAIYLALMEGKSESTQSIYHQNQTIALVQQRLKDPSTCLSDATIGAISCLALGESLTGNSKAWRMHMLGLKEMVRARGNSPPFSPLMQAKLRRSDVTGAIDYEAPPVMDFERSDRPPTWSILSLQELELIRSKMTTLLIPCHIRLDLINIMSDLSLFNRTTQTAKTSRILMDPTVFSEDLYFLEHRLLSYITTEKHKLEKALKIGALIYLKGILQEFPHSLTGNSILISRLKDSLGWVVKVGEKEKGVLAWLFVLGALVATGETKQWFVEKAMELFELDEMAIFDEEWAMDGLLGLRWVYGEKVELRWEGAETGGRSDIQGAEV